MSDWSDTLDSALASGDPHQLQAVLAELPRSHLSSSMPYIAAMGRTCTDQGKFAEALSCYDLLTEVAPLEAQCYEQRAQVHLALSHHAAALADARKVTELSPQLASGYRLQGRAHDQAGEHAEALDAYRSAAVIDTENQELAARIKELETILRKKRMIDTLLQEEEPAEPEASEPLPSVVFDPALLFEPTLPSIFTKAMVDGIKQHLLRFSHHQSSKNTLGRLEDPVWLEAWEGALAGVGDSTLLCCGSELGVLPLRAFANGACRVIAVDQSALDARLCAGIVQKNLLMQWHATCSEALAASPEEDKRASFDAYSARVEIVAPDARALEGAAANYFAFPDLDHTLLGTGLVKAVHHYREHSLASDVQILPARARIFAMGIQWEYSVPFSLDALNALRWSPYPEMLDASGQGWSELTDTVCVGEIDFAAFAETRWEAQLTPRRDGRLDGIVFWFELELGHAKLSNGPGSSLRCIRPAFQYNDPLDVRTGVSLPVQVAVTATRLHFRTRPPASAKRSSQLPSWYVPMLLDKVRNDAYTSSLEKLVVDRPSGMALDIGAGCGLLSMFAARAGVPQVVGCEVRPSIQRIGQQVVAQNGFTDRIALVAKDCRKLEVPLDLPTRADLALFEMFDCSLIGEGVLHYLAYARKNLLAAEPRYLPCSGKIRAMIIEYRYGTLLGVDVNLLNPYLYSPSFINVDAGHLKYRALTEPFDVFSFDFASAGPEPQEAQFTLSASDDGIAGAVLFWFELQFDADHSLSNAPGVSPGAHWKQALQFLHELHVKPGASLPLSSKHDGSSLTFSWRDAELDKSSLSKLPRFDPRWWQQAAELESQTQSLMHHCAMHPDEYAKVAQLALLLAVDPGAHGLDPRIAQRFASMFLSNG